MKVTTQPTNQSEKEGSLISKECSGEREKEITQMVEKMFLSLKGRLFALVADFRNSLLDKGFEKRCKVTCET